jgi:DNA-3-methyladenine glycosylase II
VPEPWPEAVAILRADPHFGPVVETVGPCRIRASRGSRFASLVSAIVYQQLAGAAARTIHGRLVDALGRRVTPERILATEPDRLRAAGLSRNKLAAVLDLAERSLDGTLRLRSLGRLSDDEVVEHLTVVRGIGPWTARMFLMFDLHRPDVWPVGDLGVRKGWARIHGLDAVPPPPDLQGAAEHLRPWRSAAAWYCWRAVEMPTPG